jgi:16S rRNA (guanine1207-N2)-methyltransferase
VTVSPIEAVYGVPPSELADVPLAAVQVSPLHPGAQALEALAPGSLTALTALAPPGVIERRYTLACALRALQPGAPLTALALKTRGGSRLRGELEAFGCAVEETARRHHRICHTARPDAPVGLEAAIGAGAPRFVEALGLWSQPGVFSWDRIDPGSALLAKTLPAMHGKGADLGCGIGVLAHAILASPKVTALTLIDLDRRAIDCARRNVADPRAALHWADVREGQPPLADLDFVVMNPPFHDGGAEDRGLGQAFIARASGALRKGGVCWLVANRHLPYERPLEANFAAFDLRAEAAGYKIFEAKR